MTLYCNGTYNEPVILIDIAAHRDYPDQVAKSVAHEVVHAIQESEWEGEGERADEAQAEELEL